MSEDAQCLHATFNNGVCLGCGHSEAAILHAELSALRARLAEVERERDELLVERAGVSESVATMRMLADSADEQAKGIESDGNDARVSEALRNVADVFRNAAEYWNSRPSLPCGSIASQLVEERDAREAAERDGDDSIGAHQLCLGVLGEAESARDAALSIIATAERMGGDLPAIDPIEGGWFLPCSGPDGCGHRYPTFAAAVQAWGEANREETP